VLRELKTFITVARQGTFSAAGQQIGLTQSAVSAQIRQLERDLGVRLFDRTGRAALLNAAGQQALPLAEQILSLYEQMSTPTDVAHWHGELKIGAIATVQTGMLPEALMRFRQDAPHVDIKLVPGVSLHLLGRVDAGEIDLALMIKPPFAMPKELDEIPLAREPFVLIAPIHTASLEDAPLTLLATQPFVRYDRGSFGGRQVSRFLQEQRLTVNETLELDELEAIVRMVECGLGVALIPQAGLLLGHAQVRVLSLGTLTFYRELVAIRRRGLRKQAALSFFMDCVQAAVQR
jgi:DNA-binding transcriptional LysR family regulator